MGCFRFFRIKKKWVQPISASISAKHVVIEEITPVALPEPQCNNRSLQSAPPSFKIRSNPIQPIKRRPNGRNRALSAPSSLDVTDEIILSSTDFDAPNPQPLPLPSLQNTASLTNVGSFKSVNVNTLVSSSEPLPLPPLCGIKNFSHEEIAHACQNFSFDRCKSRSISSNMYKASFGDDFSETKKLEATVAYLVPSSQGLKEFINEVNVIGSLQHPQLCKLLGFHAREGSNEQILVYERLFYGSLDQLLYEQSDGPILDWSARVKIALCAAKGLAFLHEEGPFQAMYNEFSTTNIQVDKDFSAKLSGYGCLNHKLDKLMSSMTAETQERELLTPKSNVWSFGIILLELLTGRKNLDTHQPNEEKNLIKWTRPFLADDSRLSLIMDPQLKCRFPSKAARVVADIASKCLHREPSERPTMRNIVESLKSIQDMKYICRFPLQEPTTSTITIRNSPVAKVMTKSPSLSGIITPAPGLNPSPSPPMMMGLSTTSLLPPRSCSSVSLYDRQLQDQKNNRRSSSTTTRRGRVEGF